MLISPGKAFSGTHMDSLWLHDSHKRWKLASGVLGAFIIDLLFNLPAPAYLGLGVDEI